MVVNNYAQRNAAEDARIIDEAILTKRAEAKLDKLFGGM